MRVLPIRFVVLLYSVSGVAGLAWQVLWVQAFVPVFGGGLEAIAAVTAWFLLGLGCGAMCASTLLKRWRPLKLYGLAEGFVGIWGIALPWMIQAFSALSAGALADLQNGFVEILALLGTTGWLVGIPAFALGTTYPAVTSALDADRHPERAGVLYGLNALGAGIGALVGGLWLPWTLGLIRGSIALGLVNLAVAVCALSIDHAGPLRVKPSLTPEPPRRHSTPLVWVLAASCGWTGLSLEISWSRLSSPLLASRLGGDAEAFGLVAAAVLVGIGLGGIWARRTGQGQWMHPFAWIQIGLVLTGCLILEPIRSFLFPVQMPLLEGLLAFPAAICLGMSFPVLANVLHGQDGGLGRIGMLFGVNGLAACAGSVFTAWFAIPALGAQRWLILLLFTAAISGALPYVAARHKVGTARVMGFAVIPCALGLVFVPPSAGHRLLRTGEHLIASQEGRLSTTVVGEGQTGERFLVSGGHRIASGRYAQVNDHVLRGHTPIDLSPAPKRVLLIGLGTGETAAAILKRPAVEHLRCVEIDGNQRDLLPFFGTQHILHHSNFDLVTDDGRHHLRMTDEKWDVITVDAYGPRTASAAFYSQQFYIEAKKHLLPDGLLFVKLDPLSMFSSSILGSYLTTFFDVFPHGSLVYIRRGFFGLVGRLKSPVSIDSNYVVAARGDTLPAQLGSPRRVTDDWPLRVPVVYQPNPDVLAPWWRAQHGDRPMPWAALRPQTKGGKTP